MELILWRHADAEPAAPGQPDVDRALTDKGRKQARKMADWLQRVLPDDCRILASPAARTVQTVEALGRPFITHPALGTDTTPDEVLRAAGWPAGNQAVLVVGHQPTLGQIAGLLISGRYQEWAIRKGSVCWIGQAPGEAPAIRVMIGPDLVDK